MESELLLTDSVVHEDTGLIRRIQRGDMAAFEALFFKYQGQIFRTALAITRDPGAAEEVLQDCFYKTYLNIMNISGEGSLSPWLHRVAVNLSCNALKKRRVRLEPLDDVAESFITADPRQSPEHLAERAELQVQMRDAINTLPVKHRVVVTLHYLQDFSLPEIAYILELPVGTVKSRLHHARKSLRDKLGTQDVTPWSSHMMRPIRALAEASADLLDDIRGALATPVISQPASEQEDRQLDALVRHAMQHNSSREEADADGIWQRLSGRVVGPFGLLAVEGPVGRSQSGNEPSGGSGFTLQERPNRYPGNSHQSQPSRRESVYSVALSRGSEALAVSL